VGRARPGAQHRLIRPIHFKERSKPSTRMRACGGFWTDKEKRGLVGRGHWCGLAEERGGVGPADGGALRMLEQTDSGPIPVRFKAPARVNRGVIKSGWLAGEVIAAGELGQGRVPSLLRGVMGLALIDTVRSRRSKSLARGFALAVTAERVVAFAIGPRKEGGRADRQRGQDRRRRARFLATRPGAADRSAKARCVERPGVGARRPRADPADAGRRSQHRRADRNARPLTGGATQSSAGSRSVYPTRPRQRLGKGL
jgi:hypothetical protein